MATTSVTNKTGSVREFELIAAAASAGAVHALTAPVTSSAASGSLRGGDRR